MKILYFGDPIASIGQTFAEEAKYVKRYLKEFVFGTKKFKFVSTIDSLQPRNSIYDILIFDFGGIGLGASDTALSFSRYFLKLIEERPNTLFVAWTSFTTMYLKEECEKELGKYPNLICRDTNQEIVINEIKEWIKN